jgi:xanthine/uracil permease
LFVDWWWLGLVVVLWVCLISRFKNGLWWKVNIAAAVYVVYSLLLFVVVGFFRVVETTQWQWLMIWEHNNKQQFSLSNI